MKTQKQNILNAQLNSMIKKLVYSITTIFTLMIVDTFFKKVFQFINFRHSNAGIFQGLAARIDIDAKEIEDDLWMKASGLHPPDKSVPYHSCNYIEGGLIFAGDQRIHLCCIINLKSPTPYDQILLSSTSKSEFSLKNILKKRKEVIEENRKGGYIACIGCQLLQKKMWPYRRDLFNYLNIMHSRSCNLVCKFCGVINFDRSPNTPTKEVFDIIQQLTSGGYLAKNTNISIGGGEPVMIDDFDRLLGYLTKEDYQISIASNGTIFSNAICDAFKSGKICNMIISVDAASPEVYKSIKGKDFCDRVWDNIRRYAEFDSKKTIPKMIIMEENINDVEQFIQKSIESGVNNVMYDYDQNITPTPEIIDALKHFNKYCDDCGLDCLPAREGLRELL